MSRSNWIVGCLALTLAACSQSSGGGDASADTADVQTADVLGDLVLDVPADANVDAAPDAAADSTTETGVDAANDVVAMDGSFSCGTMTCGSSQVCYRHLVTGGAVMLPDDAGMCAAGYVNMGGVCQRQPTYACVARPTACGSGPVTCSCAGLCATGEMCATPNSNEVDCTLLAP